MKIKFFIFCLLFPLDAIAELPLSAIDWLDEKRLGAIQFQNSEFSQDGEPPVSTAIEIPDIQVSSLTDKNNSAVGLLPPEVTGFPLNIWYRSNGEELLRLFKDLKVSNIPAIQRLVFRLLLTETEEPFNSDSEHSFLATRLEKLIEYGAVEPALALLKRASPLPATLIPYLFDLSLLVENLAPACEQVLQLGQDFPDDAARIYCFARKGDWLTANLILETSAALGTLDQREAALLHLFLETDIEDTLAAQLPPPSTLTPLEFRIYEAIGDPLSPSSLPRAFSSSDLSGNNGWKAQIKAAERLSATGALSDNRLLGIYTEHKPSASGAIWARASLIQKMEKALVNNDTILIQETLNDLLTNPNYKSLLVPFARIFSPRLLEIVNETNSEKLIYKLALLSPYYSDAAMQLQGNLTEIRFETAVTTGNFTGFIANNEFEAAIKEAYVNPRVPYVITSLLEQGKLGEVILNIMIQLEKGAAGDMQDLLESISSLRLIGLGETACQSILFLSNNNNG